ncbi:MAG: hypothetical protein LBF76_01905, partial [Holosporales bacterium]|nr:hypothetical protein [Holosporales bacterium]
MSLRKERIYVLLASTCLVTSLLVEGMQPEGIVLPGNPEFLSLTREQQIENAAILWETNPEVRDGLRKWLGSLPYEDAYRFSSLVLDLLEGQRPERVAHLLLEEQMFQSPLYSFLCDVINQFSSEEAVQFSDRLLLLAREGQLSRVYKFFEMSMPFGWQSSFLDTMFKQKEDVKERRKGVLCHQLTTGMLLVNDVVRNLSFEEQYQIFQDSALMSCVPFEDQEDLRLLLALDCLKNLRRIDRKISRKGAKGLRPLPWLASRKDEGPSWKVHEEKITRLVAQLYSLVPQEGPYGGLSSFLAFCVGEYPGLIHQKALHAQVIRDYILSDKERVAFLRPLYMACGRSGFELFDCLSHGFDGWSEPERAEIQVYIDAKFKCLRDYMNAKSVPDTRRDMALEILRYNGTYAEQDETRREALIYLVENSLDVLDQEVGNRRITLNPAEEEIRHQWLFRVVHQPKKPLAITFDPVVDVLKPLASVFGVIKEEEGVPSLFSTPLSLTYEPNVKIPRSVFGAGMFDSFGKRGSSSPSFGFGASLIKDSSPVESPRSSFGAAPLSDSSKWIVPYHPPISSSSVPVVSMNVSLG